MWSSLTRLYIRLCCWVWSGVLEESIMKKRPALAWLIVLPWALNLPPVSGAEQPTSMAQRCSHTSHGGMLNKNMEITDTDCVKVSWLVINMTSSSESSGNLRQLWGEWSWSKLRQIVSKQCWYHTCLLRKGHNVLVCLCTLSGWKRRALDLA